MQPSVILMYMSLAKDAFTDGDRQFQETMNSVPEYNDRAKLNPPEANTLLERKKTEAVKRKALLKRAADFAPGLPSKSEYGDVTTLPIGQLIPYVRQLHEARRAGTHEDVRFGPDKMFSWASRKGIPAPGKKRLLNQTQLHRGSYANFEGEILSGGYGAGMVKRLEKGSVVVTKAEPQHINFTVVSRKAPENFSLIKMPKQRQWLLINTTPQSIVKFLGGKTPEIGAVKPRYTLVPEKDVDRVFDPKYLVQAKLDGASALFRLLHDRIDAVSYRTTKTGKPIVHTMRIFGLGGSTKSVKIPPEFVNTILRGEIFGVRKADGAEKVIPSQELGGLLNSSVERSLAEQKRKGIELRAALFDIVRSGKEPMQNITAPERREKLQQLLQYLPQPKFELPEEARTPDEARDLWNRISSGLHPRTSEGIVAFPREGGRPLKVKLRPETDLWIRGIFPGAGRLAGRHAGGFEYARSPESDAPIVGRVGTGFDLATRRDMMENPEDWIGRVAKVRSQGAFPSGALRAPTFLARHEDI